MGIYSKIKSPLENIDTRINDLLKIYSDSIESGYDRADSFYRKTVYGSKKENQNEYINEFDKYIKRPCFSELYKNIRAMNTEKHDKDILEKAKAENQTTNKSLDYILSNYILYPLSKYKNVFDRFQTYEELESYVKKNRINELYQYIKKIKFYPHMSEYKEEFKQKILELNIPLSMEENIVKLYELDRKLNACFSGGSGIMGFHVNKNKLLSSKEPLDKIDIKLYINAGKDTYKFAYYFKQLCDHDELNYYFKVANPLINEQDRLDKLCVFCSYKNAENFLNIIEAIKYNVPEFNFEPVPYLCGTIDDVIGVGEDPKYTSYNHAMGIIFSSSIEQVFGLTGIKSIIPVNPNDERISLLKEIIIEKADSKGLDPKKICISKKSKMMLQDTYLG